MMREWFDRDGNDDDQAVAEYMTRLGNAVPPQVSQVPDPGVLWAKAQMLRRWDAERKAQAPLDVMEPIQIAVGIAAALVLFVWSLPSLIQTLFTSI
jgi:HEAT repeat protein